MPYAQFRVKRGRNSEVENGVIVQVFANRLLLPFSSLYCGLPSLECVTSSGDGIPKQIDLLMIQIQLKDKLQPQWFMCRSKQICSIFQMLEENKKAIRKPWNIVRNIRLLGSTRLKAVVCRLSSMSQRIWSCNEQVKDEYPKIFFKTMDCKGLTVMQ